MFRPFGILNQTWMNGIKLSEKKTNKPHAFYPESIKNPTLMKKKTEMDLDLIN